MKIAIIDDSIFMRRLITGAIQQIQPDAVLTEFTNGEEALAQLPKLAPDLITLDMLMPKMDGLALLEALKTSALRPRVIVITANVQNSVRQKCADFGVTDFIEKPITFDKLQASFTKLLAA